MNRTKYIVVTGATSLLAYALIAKLLQAGYVVRGLVRNRSAYRGQQHPNLEFVECDITKVDSYTAALEGAEAVAHCAALTTQGADNESYRRINTQATIELIKAAEAADVKTFINVSSANVYAYGSKEHPGDESKPFTPPFSASLYAQSKMLVQEYIRAYEGTMRIVTIAPTFMLGEGRGASGAERIVKMGLRRVVVYPMGGKNFVSAEDVATGIIAAMQQGRHQAEYLLTGENLSYREFFMRVARLAGRKSIRIPIPTLLLKMVGVIGEVLMRCGIRTEINLTNMRILSVGNYYRHDKATDELGYVASHIDIAIISILGSRTSSGVAIETR